VTDCKLVCRQIIRVPVKLFDFCVQVFDIVLNGQITVVEGLDIFAKVGRGVAHDEIIPFSVRNGQLHYGAEVASFTGKLLVEFVKVSCDRVICHFLFGFSN